MIRPKTVANAKCPPIHAPREKAGSFSRSTAPTPRKRRVSAHPFALTKAQRADVELTLHLCGEGLKPEYAAKLAASVLAFWGIVMWRVLR